MIPSTTYSAPLSSKKEGFPLRPLSANLSSPTSPLAQRRNRNNKNLSLCLTPSSTTISNNNNSNTNLDINHLIPPSTPFTPFKTNQSTKHYEHGPICILPGVYLGDESNSVNDTQLKLYNINYIMNVATEVNHPRVESFDKWEDDHQNNNNEVLLPCPTLSSSSSSTNSSSSSSSLSLTSSPTRMTTTTNNNNKTIKYKKRSWHHQIMDNDQTSLKELHDAVMDIVNVKELNKNILIHCQCGLARSASIIIAYVMYTRQISMQLAIIEVKKQAPHINPNFSLMYHLREYERWLMIKQATTWSSSKKSIQHKSSTDTIKSNHSSFVAKWKNFKSKSIYRHQWWRSSTSTSNNNNNNNNNNITTTVTTTN